MQTQAVVERMQEAIPKRQFVETTESFCELLTHGYPLRQAVQDVIDAGAPYTHLPCHLSIQHGRPHKISNDHCLLDTRAALYLMQYMPPEARLLPVVQSVWYWPQGIDVWGQTELESWTGDTTDTILALMKYLKSQGIERYPQSDDWRHYPPATRHYTSEVEPIVDGGVEERLDALQRAIMLCRQDEAYGLFLGLAPEVGVRKRLASELLYSAMTDVQERIGRGHLKTLQHTTLRARALIDLADYLGWEHAQSVFQAAIPDLAIGPHYFGLHDHVATICDDEFGDSLSGLKTQNTAPLTAEETEMVMTTILSTEPNTIVDLITRLLREGKAIQGIADAITVAAARIVTLAEKNGSNPIVWVHSVDYCNVVNTWLRQYDHPCQAQGLYFMALVTHYAIPGFPIPAFTDSISLDLDDAAMSSHRMSDELITYLNDSIAGLDIPSSLTYANAYLQSGAEARPLMSALAMAASKTQDNPHHHKIISTALEEYDLSTSPQKSELLLMGAAYLSGARTLYDCYELYGKYFPVNGTGNG